MLLSAELGASPLMNSGPVSLNLQAVVLTRNHVEFAAQSVGPEIVDHVATFQGEQHSPSG